MRLKEISELSKNPNLISGIHNYCDRWCERCAFTARCLLYATEEASSDNDPASRDIGNAAFWQKLTAIFQETQEMISTMAEEQGVDLSPRVLAAEQAEHDKQRRQARNHPLAKAGEKYALDVNEWFERDAHQVETFSDEAGSDETLAEENANDMTAVIRWYQFFIAAKLIRGLLSRLDEDEYLAADDPRDSEGSVKAALIAIDRSLAAWKLMIESHPESREAIHKLLMDLEKLRLLAEKEFPQARDFIRPGFDEDLDQLH